MRKILITLIAATFLVSCQKEEYTISGNIKNFKGSDYVYLEIQGKDKPKTIDSIKIKDGKFEFKGKADSMDIAFIKIPALKSMFPFVLENGSINVDINKDSIYNPKISGTENNEELQNFNDKGAKLGKKLEEFGKKNQQKYIEAISKNDQATAKKLNDEATKLQNELMDYSKNYMKEKNNFVALLILENYATKGQMPANEAKPIFEKFSDELKNTKSGIRINKVINPTAEKKK